jgi:hypothetical protein
LGDTGQVTQAVPHALTLVESTQIPLQGFWVPGQWPSQAAASSTQPLMHGFFPAGHSTPHLMPSQTALPSVRPGQGTHAVPQWSASLLLTHVPLHLWEPVGHPGSVTMPSASGDEPGNAFGSDGSKDAGASGGEVTAPPTPASDRTGATLLQELSSGYILQSTDLRFRQDATDATTRRAMVTAGKCFMGRGFRFGSSKVASGQAATRSKLSF